MSVLKKSLLVLLALLLLLGVTGIAAYAYLRYQLQRAPAAQSQVDAFFARPAQRPAFAAASAAPCAQHYPLRKAWFGALHIHTAASYDAYAFGVTNSADDAYAFARGATRELRLWTDPAGADVPSITISQPLDFAAVTDHAEKLGEQRLCLDPRSDAHTALVCRVYRGEWQIPMADNMQPLLRLASQAIFGITRSARVCGEDGAACRLEARNAWVENQRATEQWQDRSADCSFTTFPAYEYTLAEQGSNLHRNVIFANATVPPAVVSAKEKQTPEALWQWLKQSCVDANAGCDVLAIPHNSNWSSGRMWFPYSYREDLSEQQRREFASLRQQLEPLAEIMQVKGDSECRNGLPSVVGSADELCDFEKLRAPAAQVIDCGEHAGSGNMLLQGCISRFSYLRYALSTGLAEQARLGVNPFKLGIIAATDNHNGTPAAGPERGYLGASGSDRSARRRLLSSIDVPGGIARGSPVRYNPGGIAGVWAEENSRAAIFAAMQRRETFGSSGPRIQPRFFASWDMPLNLCSATDMVQQAYATAVPMGSDLPARPGSVAAPLFVASATQDPGGNLLQSIQVIKGWIDAEGHTRQAVIPIAGNPANGAAVDTDTCAVSGPGYAQLCGTWQDSEFDPALSAVYYARVVENPSCRWSNWQCNALPAAERPPGCSDPTVAKTIQERAWTSPIWYTAH